MTDGKTKTINGLKSKSGKKFDCALKLSPEFKVVLDLPDQGPSETFSTPCPKCKGENTLHVNDVKLWCSTCDFVHRQVSGDYQRLAYIINDYQGVHFERLSF